MNTIGDIFPGNMGRVRLTRVALKLRMPALLTTAADLSLDSSLVVRLMTCLAEVQKG